MKSEMSPFGKAIFEAFGEITRAQAQLMKTQQDLVNTFAKLVDDGTKPTLFPRDIHNKMNEIMRHNEHIADQFQSKTLTNHDGEPVDPEGKG